MKNSQIHVRQQADSAHHTVTLEAAIDRTHAGAVHRTWLHVLASFSRLALAVGFIAPGLTKVMGYRFANWGTETTAGYFFDAFYRTGGYYHFVGLAQILAGALLLHQRTAALGAVLYCPIIVNIAVFTTAEGFAAFRLTAIISLLMLLACMFLLCWYYPAWKRVIFPAGPDLPTPVTILSGPMRVAWCLGAAGGIALTVSLRGIVRLAIVPRFSLALLAVSIVLGLWGWWRARDTVFRPAA